MIMMISAIGVVLAVFGVGLRLRAQKDRAARAAWLTTRGAVVSSRVTVEEVPGENGGSFDRFGANYSYAAAGTPHRGYIYSDKAKHHKTLLAKYPAGGAVDVFYDPAKPGHSEIRDPLVLAGGWIDGLYRFGFVLIPLGAIVALVGLVLPLVQ